ncbi:uncharacterized protein LOC120193557 [Hibiscus syriacus]|uniref:uncharacterized protein LOC120193557 n=1 Tax=Hibiscus syriacus TaxID=106335 RepID=UPI001920992A|nr:uncharacterized protein LOC120193557 [Hibiscus syriacus]
MGDYKFLKIKDAITCINQKVAAIADLSPPHRTKGIYYICKLKIIDESHEFRIPVHLFAQQIDDLPLAASVGDIIHLSRVKVCSDIQSVFSAPLILLSSYFNFFFNYTLLKLLTLAIFQFVILSCLCMEKIRLEDEVHNPLPLHFEPLPTSRDVLSTFPTAGTILRMRLDVNCRTDILQLLKIGQRRLTAMMRHLLH